MTSNTSVGTGGFKVGNKVRCIDTQEAELSSKIIYTVTEVRVYCSNVFIAVNGMPEGWRPERFELVKEEESAVEYRKGDIVHLRAEVLGLGQSAAILTSDGKRTTLCANLSHCPPVHVEERSVAVGDTVSGALCSKLEVLAIVGPDAWVKAHSGQTGYICPLKELTRID